MGSGTEFWLLMYGIVPCGILDMMGFGTRVDVYDLWKSSEVNVVFSNKSLGGYGNFLSTPMYC